MKNRNANWLQEKGGRQWPGKSNELETGRQNLKDLFKIFGGTPSRKKCGMWLTEIAAFAQIRAFVKQVQVFWVILLDGMTGRLEEPPVWKISSHSMVQRQPTWDQTRCCFGKSSAQSSKLTTHLEQLRKKPGAKIRHCYVVGFRSKARVVFLSFFLFWRGQPAWFRLLQKSSLSRSGLTGSNRISRLRLRERKKAVV